MKKKRFLEFEPRSRNDWRTWLKLNHSQSDSIWVIIHKKSSPIKTLSTSDVVEEALCFGWIDSVPNKLDEHRFKLLVSPRKPKSPWSAVNKRKIKKLIKDGKMTAAGLVKIEQAKKDGSWKQLDLTDQLIVPVDLRKRLATSKAAASFFDEMPKSAKRAILEWIEKAKKPETRSKRIEETVSLAKQGKRALFKA